MSWGASVRHRTDMVGGAGNALSWPALLPRRGLSAGQLDWVRDAGATTFATLKDKSNRPTRVLNKRNIAGNEGLLSSALPMRVTLSF